MWCWIKDLQCTWSLEKIKIKQNSWKNKKPETCRKNKNKHTSFFIFSFLFIFSTGSGFKPRWVQKTSFLFFRLFLFFQHAAGSNPGGCKKIKKPNSTGDSLVVPYQSTDPAQRCLTSQFGWDAVLSPWYDRMTRTLNRVCISVWKNKRTRKNKRSRVPPLFYFYFFILEAWALWAFY